MGSGSLGSLLLVLGLGALAGLLGETLLRRLPPMAGGVLVRLPIATGLGLGLLGLPAGAGHARGPLHRYRGR